MIIESIRLKNIKSYGSGDDGRGVTIELVPGVNRIAGLNGHGKTTLIEAIGYALFFCEPSFEENFNISTYLLRAGEKSGEIDIDFQHRHERYRIERSLGAQTRRRTKVIQIEDGSICAEGEAEVTAFLCRLFGIERIQHFAELFEKLVGVRQGRLTWPFDATLGEAKKFFEPLLEVAVFRECYDRLKPVVDEFGERAHEQKRALAGIEERIRERAGTEKLIEEKNARRSEFELRLEKLTRGREAARIVKEGLEVLEKRTMDAERNREAFRSAINLARQQYEHALVRRDEALAASEVIATAGHGYRIYEEAEVSLRQLRIQQQTATLLERERNEAEKRRTVLEGKRQSAGEQADFLRRQIEEKKEIEAGYRERANALERDLAASLADFELRLATVDRAVKDAAEINLFVQAAESSLTERDEHVWEIVAIQEEIKSWNGEALEEVRRRESAADLRLQEIRQQLAEADSARLTLTNQLAAIGGGVCPFLKEQCRQFDPAKVGEDLGARKGLVEFLQRETKIAKSEFDQAKADRERSEREAAEMMARRIKLDGLMRRSVNTLNVLALARIEPAAARLVDQFADLEGMPRAPSTTPGNASELMVAHQASFSFNQEVIRWKEALESKLNASSRALDDERRQRDFDAQNLKNLQVRQSDLREETEKLIASENSHRETARSLEEGIRKATEDLINLAAKSEIYSAVAGEIAKMEQIQQSQRQDHQRYLGAKPLADQISLREEESRNRESAMVITAKELESREKAYLEIRKEFDPITLAAARKEFDERGQDIARESAHLANAIEELKREEKRQHEWEMARKVREAIVGEIARIEASIDLTEFTRTALKGCAPEVAQHLCDRIADRAQQIFNQINHDPVQLKWEAMPRYSLRVIPGDRRFAMLSGGEQTKLALSVTLAMIQQFSGIRFCIFDEPTYGVDAESRDKLADAILTAERVADLDQLIIVSHDDSFNGKIEHSILLRKHADLGTQVV